MTVISERTLELFDGFWKRRPSLGMEILDAEQDFFNEVYSDLKPNSIIVFGCGTGREFKYTDKATFYAVDFTLHFLKQAHRSHPNANLILATLEALPFREGARFDLGLTSVVLQHIPHEEIEGVTENIKSLCNAVILVEGVSIPEADYQFNHNYKELFKPMALKKTQARGNNPYTHLFFFHKERR